MTSSATFTKWSADTKPGLAGRNRAGRPPQNRQWSRHRGLCGFRFVGPTGTACNLAHDRHPQEGAAGRLQARFQILHHGPAGQDRVLPARLMNVSTSGLQLQMNEHLTLRSYVTCNDVKHGIAGRGCVRYCNFTKGKYVVGPRIYFRDRLAAIR